MTEIQNGFLKEIMPKVQNADILDFENMDEIVYKFKIEFEHGKFFAPIIVESDQNFILVSYDTEDGSLLPLFTSPTEIGEFSKYNITDVTYLDYIPMLEDESFFGFIINPFSDKFFFSRYSYSNLLKENDDSNVSGGKIFDKNELKQAKENMDNKEIIDLIKNSPDIEDLIDKIGQSYLLTIVRNEKKINRPIVKNKRFSLLKTKDWYVLIFTNEKDLIKESKKHKGYLYSQLINLPAMVHFILYDDLSGIIIDKGTEHEFKITRDDLIKNLKQIEEKCYNVELENTFNYGFKLKW